MDQFPTEEEEFELMYQDEMELLEEIHDEEVLNIDKTQQHPQSNNFAPNTSVQLNQTQESLLKSPQLSQISFGSAKNSNKLVNVNRKLFNSSINCEAARVSSTPIGRTETHRNQNDKFAPSTSIIVEEENGEPMDVFQEIQNVGLKKRRRLEDLFGDIHDIEREEYEDPEVKKFKIEEERDMEMISKILEARKRCREIKNPLKKDSVDRLNALHEFKKKNLSYTIPNWPCITVVKNDLERIYVRMHSEDYEAKEIDEINVFTKGYRGLLGESKEEIWNIARELTLKRMTASAGNCSNEQNGNIVEYSEHSLLNDQCLWVDKYRPKKYLDLLSDETTNRSLLYWLKMWDKVVFGREFGKKALNGKFEGQQLNSFNKRTGKFESTGGWNRKTKQNLNINLDSHGRPMQKVALLCGPPGLGKTTLAHTIARHAGYCVRELNASDDRSPEAFRLALENGTQMTSVLNEDKRPNCIILDEIDGAPSQSIDFLIRFTADNYTVKSKKGKEHKSILKRPIICICNDMYAPALRQLRQVAFVVNFPPIESSRLAERLLDICKKEHLKVDLGTLLALADKSGNDVRSCISMLQFYSGSKKNLTLIDVLNANLGQKDRHRGLFGIWSAIFQIQRPQKQLANTESRNSPENDQLMVTMTNMSLSTRVKYIYEILHMAGDYERLMQGVFENYLLQKMPDPNLDGVLEAANWFCFSDLLQTQINHLQNYSIYPYLQFGFITWHLLFASLSWPKITFPNKGFEVHQKSTTHKMIFTSFRKGVNCNSIGIGTGATILLETLPFLKSILSPNLRSVSSQLLTTKERHELSSTVGIMVDLGLVFTQTKAIDGTYQYCLEPDIDMLIKFPDFKGISLSYFGRQLIAREVELEKMRRSAPKIINNNNDKNNSKKIAFKSNSKNMQEKSPPQENLPNYLQCLKPKIRQSKKNQKETISKDFFGRICTKSDSATTDERISDPIVKSPIWYRYKEGFNNAVRKDVTMAELL
ncbi:chromosome transmission fidelity protein 18 homolog [Condylostylus longicornis]|uniref:chromosome transmission fidelity protein 18 homolog n=1 Tax=Condylostylus longicornis TaxID=2530218 RepID=UPI00244E0814|nr:chromosome transmission fidelity protein 18 homolog [Condylostylus longicornis]